MEKAAELTTDRSYRTWFGRKALAIKDDVLLEHFRDIRNTEIHVRRVPLQRHVSLTVRAVLRTSAYGEMRVKRAQPWYRRSPSILWQDLWASVTRPLKRWRYQLTEWAWRRRAQLDARLEPIKTRLRTPTKVSVMDFFFDDPEGLDRPAVVLVQVYLSRWEAIITEAETSFPQVFAH